MTEPRVVVLTPQQRRVIGELALDGAGNQEIADRLFLSEWTVRSHLKSAMRRMGLPTRTAVVCALLRGHVVIRVEDNR